MTLDERATETVWLNGEFVDWDDAQYHALSHVANYGTGVFEGSRCYETPEGPAVFRLDAHLDRLADSAAVLDIDLDYSTADLRAATLDLIRQNGLDSCYVRHNVSYGYGSLGLDTDDCPVNTLIAAMPRETYLGADAVAEGADVELSPWRRLHSSQFPTQVKAIGPYVMNALAKRHAVANGYDEAILLDVDGNVAEGSGENVFVVDDGRLYTPGLDSSVLPGITRRSLVRIARDRGYEVSETRLTTGQLYTADEAFLCGTAAEITPVRSVDDVTIGDGEPGPVTTELREAFFEAARGGDDRYRDWLRVV